MNLAVVLVVLLVLIAVTRAKRPVDIYSARVAVIAYGIAVAEGYFVPGSAPARLNNPGALKGSDGRLREFRTADEGWAALFDQVARMLSGRSAYYRPDMTIREIAQIYTGGDNPEGWARTVAGYVGVTPDTRLVDV